MRSWPFPLPAASPGPMKKAWRKRSNAGRKSLPPQRNNPAVVIPQVLTLPSYAAALQRAAQADKALLFYENERATTLRMALESGPYETVSLLTGPEGGLEEKEVKQAMEAGLQVCTLGKRILRCETAPLCALSAVMYDAGEF